MNEQIKELEFTDWFYYYMTKLDNLFTELTELKVINQYEFPRISVFYLHEMFWSSEVSVATRNCQTQKEYDEVIKQLTEKELKIDIKGILKNKNLNKDKTDKIISDLNINFCIH